MRYLSKPRNWIEDEVAFDDSPMIPALSVDDHEAVDTGLLWADGSSIMRAPNPMGFGRDDEW